VYVLSRTLPLFAIAICMCLLPFDTRHRAPLFSIAILMSLLSFDMSHRAPLFAIAILMRFSHVSQ
jgi:hypothetical protein